MADSTSLSSGWGSRQWISWREVLLVGLLTLIIQWPILQFPLGLDQGIYATSALKMWEGQALYKDTWDMKSPGVFFMYMLPLFFGAGNTWTIHLLTLLMHGFAAAGIFVIARHFFGTAVGWFSTIIFVMFGGAWSTPINAGQPDDYLLGFLLWGFFCLYKAPDSNSTRGTMYLAFIAGILMGWVLVLRSTMLFAVVLAPALWMVQMFAPESLPKPRFSKFLTGLFMYVAGGLFIGCITLSYFLLTGSLYDLYYSQGVWVQAYATTQFNFNRTTLGHVTGYAYYQWGLFFGRIYTVYYWPVFALLGIAVWKGMKGSLPLRGLLFWLIAFCLAGTNYAFQMKFFNYHHWCLMPFISIALAFPAALFGELIQHLWSIQIESNASSVLLARYKYKLLAVGCIVVVATSLLNTPTMLNEVRRRQRRGLEWGLGWATPATYYDRFKFTHLYHPTDDHIITNYVLERTPKGEKPKIYIYGFHPNIYYYLGIGGPSKFAYNLPLRADWSPREWVDNVEGEVMKDPPDFFLVGFDDVYNWVTGDWQTSMMEMPDWMRKELEDNFALVMEANHLNLYERYREDNPPRLIPTTRKVKFDANGNPLIYPDPLPNVRLLE